LVERDDHRASSLVVIGILLRETGSDRFHLHLGLLQRDAWFEASDDFQEMISTLRCFLLWKCDRHPELVVTCCEAWQLPEARHDSDNGVAFTVECEWTANDARIRAKTPLPE